ncbi:MAG: cation:proton antiporter [Pseudomonadota bacterium]
MSGETFLSISMGITFTVLTLAFALIVVRIVRGPTLPDRILALDLLLAVAIGYIAAYGITSGFTIYVDIAIALGLIGFLSTIALARFVLTRGDVSMAQSGPAATERDDTKGKGGVDAG